MRLRELDNLVGTGLLKKEASSPAELEGLLLSGRARLADARKSVNALESRFDLAYNAGHALALAALRYHGYRPDKVRFVVFQALPHTLGLGAEVWRVLDKAHSVRNNIEYQGFSDIDERLLADVLASVGAVDRALKELVGKN